jgi:hypothetical protein
MPSEGLAPFIYDSPESEDLRSTCLALAAGQVPSGRCRSKLHAPHAQTACLRCRAACVFYAALTGRDPTRSGFTAGIGAGQAQFLQQVAESVNAPLAMSDPGYVSKGVLTPVVRRLVVALKIRRDPADGG